MMFNPTAEGSRPSPFAFLVGPELQALLHLACNNLALGQWELGGAALRQLCAHDYALAKRITQDLITRQVPGHWLPPFDPQRASQRPPLPGTAALQWWCVAQTTDLPRPPDAVAAAAIPRREYAAAELTMCAAALHPAVLAATDGSLGVRPRDASEVELAKCEDALQAALDLCDELVVSRVVDLCHQLRAELPPSSPARRMAERLPLQAARRWVSGAPDGVSSDINAVNRRWGTIGRCWEWASQEALWALAEMAAENNSAHNCLLESMLGCAAAHPLRQYCDAVARVRLTEPFVDNADLPAHLQSAEFWPNHVLFCRLHSHHVVEYHLRQLYTRFNSSTTFRREFYLRMAHSIWLRY